ncbi:MAG: iron-sulfur cluster insertion protein ErpA [Anaerolineae bacterium]
MAVFEPEKLQTTTHEEISVLTVTPAAVAVIRNLLTQRQITNHALRVFVTGGGCSGMQYGMAFEEGASEFDTVVDVEPGVRLIVDPTSLMYLEGSNIDFVDSLVGGGFRIDNPNSVSSCGCGKSFKSKDSADANDADGGCGSCSSY